MQYLVGLKYFREAPIFSPELFVTLCKRIDGKFLYPTDINILEDSSREIERLALKVISKAGITRPRSCHGEARSCFVRYTKKKHIRKETHTRNQKAAQEIGYCMSLSAIGTTKEGFISGRRKAKA